MQVELTLKNYRCFHDSKPAKIILSKGFIAFTGTNNSGKSSLLKFFYEFRNLFTSLNLNILLGNQQQIFNFPKEVLDPQEVFCNLNDRPLEIHLRFVFDDPQKYLNTPDQVVITIERDIKYTTQLFLRKQPLATERGCTLNGSELTINNTPIANLSFISEIFQDLGNTIYIGPFRNAISLIPLLDPGFMKTFDEGYFDYFDIKTGRAFIQEWQKLKTGYNRQNTKAAYQVTDDIKHIFGFNNLEINSYYDNQSVQMSIDGNSYALSEVGSGLAQFFLVLANAAVRKPSYILIDEPELNLHPSLQLDFLTTLAKYATKGILFATHSIGLSRASAERIYIVRKGNNGSEVTEYEKNPRLSELLGELSFSTYREFGFDKVLLVEGPTEIRTIQQFLRKYGKDHEILLLPLGGSSLINDAFELELQEIKRISENIFVLIDSERISPDAVLETKREAFYNLCISIGINCYVLNFRATENYFSDRAVKIVKGNEYRALEPYEKLKDTPKGWGKSENWRIAREMNLDELEATDLGDFIKRLCEA